MMSKKRRIILGIVIAVVIIAGVVYWLARPGETPPTASVQLETLEDLAEEIGEIVSDHYRVVDARVPGSIRRINAEAGENVSAGFLLIEIDSNEWQAALDRVSAELQATSSAYQQAMESAARSRQQAQENLNLAIRQRDEAIENARRQEQQAQLALELSLRRRDEAQAQLERMRVLHQAGAVSQQELAAAELEEAALSASAEEARFALESAEARLEEASLASSVEQARLAVAAAEDAMSPSARGTYEATIRQLETERQHLERQQDSWFVTAPLTGTVLVRHVEVGSFVQPGQPLIEIGTLGQLYVRTELLAREMSGITAGMPVRLIHRDLGTAPVTGTVRKVYPTAFVSISELGIEQRRVRVDIEIDRVDPQWRPGYEVDVEIIRDTRENVLTVPDRSVFFIDGESHVFVWANNQSELRSVETGLNAHNRTEIISGLSEGELVLIEPENV